MQVSMEFAQLMGATGQTGVGKAIFPRWQRRSSRHGARQLERGCWWGRQGWREHGPAEAAGGCLWHRHLCDPAARCQSVSELFAELAQAVGREAG